MSSKYEIDPRFQDSVTIRTPKGYCVSAFRLENNLGDTAKQKIDPLNKVISPTMPMRLGTLGVSGATVRCLKMQAAKLKALVTTPTQIPAVGKSTNWLTNFNNEA